MSLLAFLPTYLSLPFSSLLSLLSFERARDRRSARETIEKSEEGYIDRGGRKFVAERGIQMSIEYGGGAGGSISISIHERFIRVETTDAEHRRVSARRNITINLAELITGHAFN